MQNNKIKVKLNIFPNNKITNETKKKKFNQTLGKVGCISIDTVHFAAIMMCCCMVNISYASYSTKNIKEQEEKNKMYAKYK